MELCLSLLQVRTLADNIPDFIFSQACRMQGMMGVREMMQMEDLSQVGDGFMPLFVTSTYTG